MGDEYRIEKLNSENYRHWSLRAQGLLEAKQCWIAIDPGFANGELTAAQKALDHKAKSIFFMIVNDESLDDIADCESAQDVWDTLKNIHTSYDTWHGLLLLRDFVLTEKQQSETVGEYLTRRNGLYHKIKSAGFSFEETVLAGLAVLGLPKEYEYLSRNLRMDNEDLTLKSLKSKLTEEERRINSANKGRDDESKDESKVLLSRRFNNGRGHKYFVKDDRRRSNDGGFTNSIGKYQKENEKKYQFNEQKRSHKDLRCYRCLEFGHIARNCKSPSDEGNHACAKMITSEKSLALSAHRRGNQDNVKGIWCMDSGSTDHMTSRRDKFTTFEEKETYVEVAGGGVLLSTGRGTVKIKLSERNGGWTLYLLKTLYVPQLQGNLLSTSRISEQGLDIIFDQSIFQVLKNKEVLFTGERIGRLYCIHEEGVNTNLETERAMVNKTSSKETMLWHRRLGHLNFPAVRALIGNEDIEADVDEKIISSNCEVCLKGKLKTKTFPKKSFSKEEKPLKLIHSDVVGPINPVSKGGNQYFVTFIDDYSKFTEVHFMKRKSEVPEKFDIFRRRVENLQENKISTLRSDNGGEYMSVDFKKNLQDLGIDRQLTIPGTPQQNGIAERANQTLMDMARCMLIESGLPTHFWADAVSTAVYVRNRCPTTANEGETPIKLWKNKEIDVSHMKVFGCRAWAVDKKRKSKLSPKGIACIFIGYDKYAKAYKLWNHKTDEVFLSRDVKFEEHIFPLMMEKENTEKKPESLMDKWCALKIYEDEQTEIQQVVPDENNENEQADILEQQPVDNRPEVFDEGLVDQEGNNSQKEINNSQKETTTRSGRRVVPPKWSKDYMMEDDDAECAVCLSEGRHADPQTPEEALSGKEEKKWEAAMLEELTNHVTNGTFESTERPKGTRIIKNKWVFKAKYDEKGQLVRYKARVVALGNAQRPGLDYDKTYAPVVQAKTTRILFGIATERNWTVHHLDINAAYLISDIDEDVYMEIPKCFQMFIPELQKLSQEIPTADEMRGKDLVWKLRKSIYGLHQSGRLWNKHLNDFLQSRGLERSLADPCVYYTKERELIVTTYVDDLVLYGTAEEIERMKLDLKNEFKIKDLGEAKNILSIGIEKHTNGFTMSQTAYVLSLLKEMKMLDSKSVATPLPLGTKYEITCEKDEELNEEESHKYRQAVGSMLYLATHSRPDLTFAATFMSQFSQRPSRAHWQGVKHMLRYLNGTRNLCLRFRKNKRSLEVFTDADWGSDVSDRRSFSGFIIKLGGAPVSWISRKQRCVSLSTVEAEFVALGEVGKECAWIRNLLEEIGLPQFLGEAINIQIDNQGAIKLAENPTTSERSKHIDLKVFFIRELIEKGKIRLSYVKTEHNLADHLTKILPAIKLRQHQEKLGIIDPGGVIENVGGATGYT